MGLNQTGLAASPWARPADTVARVAAAGLDIRNMAGVAYHLHPRLTVYDHGEAMTVADGIGVEPGHGMSPLHTHGTDGVIHIESPQRRDYTLGQFFTEWGVPLTGAKVWANGSPVADPDNLVLVDQQQIVVAFGEPLPQ
jgi:hypothetical protein